VRGDGENYIITTGGVVDGSGNVSIAVAAVNPGGAANSAVGVVMTLGVSIPGIQSSGTVTTAIAGGANAESDDQLRDRMLTAFQNPVQGGAASDYVVWAREVNG
ncbi:baseplate J/gp47 family protein, partial [Lacticaseibacillus rhamnosus]|uniref:baseplate J/gp47 family protein n=1 Tax=Lacticaseibacillus rhamnosus TaxID=47715 RepID=UPI001951E7A6